MSMIGANPEVNRGLDSLYSKLREEIKQDGGNVPADFSKSFTSADGMVTLTLSTEGLGAYAGGRNVDGSVVQADDIGIHLKEVARSGTGADAVTAESNALSDAIHSVDDVNAHEKDMQQNFAITDFHDHSDQDMEALPQPSANLDAKPASTTSVGELAGISQSVWDAAQVKQQVKQHATDSLIDTLTSFLQGLKDQRSSTLKSLTSKAPDQDDDSNSNLTGSRSSLLIRVDVKA